MGNLRPYIQQVLREVLTKWPPEEVKSEFAEIVSYIESKLPLLKYYKKDSQFDSERVYYELRKDEHSFKTVTKEDVIEYSISPSSVFVIQNYTRQQVSFKGVSLSIKNDMNFRNMLDITGMDKEERDTIKNAIFGTGFKTFSYACMVHKNETFQTQLDKELNEINRSMFMFDQSVEEKYGERIFG